MIRISEALIRSVRAVPFENDEKSSEPSYLESLLSSSPDMMDSKIPGLKSLPLTRAPSATTATPLPTAPGVKTGSGTQNNNTTAATGTNNDDDDDDDITSDTTNNGAAAPPPAGQAAAAANGSGVAAKKKEPTKIVKFTPVEAAAPEMMAESPFVKERVGAKKAVASSLSKELSENGVLARAARAYPQRGHSRPTHASKPSMIMSGHITPSGPLVPLKAYVQIGKKPIELKIHQHCSVQHVIECIIQAWKASGRTPAMKENSDFYELRVLDDDDGTPDTDMQPLDRARDFRRYDVSAVAVCENPNFVGDPNVPQARAMGLNMYGLVGGKSGVMTALGQMTRTSSPSIAGATDAKLVDKKFLKIYMDEHESHVIHVPKESTVEDLLGILSKKKHIDDAMVARDFNFYPLEGKDALDMKQKVADLKHEELRLVRKTGTSSNNSTANHGSGTESTEIALSSFLFTRETAGTYCEYKVIKTNDRGKRQERILGIDAKTIWNKQDKKSARLSFDVSHDQRAMSTVHSCVIVKDRPMNFEIVFRDAAKKKLVNRHYETETKMECAEIVAKINFLMSLNPPQPLPT